MCSSAGSSTSTASAVARLRFDQRARSGAADFLVAGREQHDRCPNGADERPGPAWPAARSPAPPSCRRRPGPYSSAVAPLDRHRRQRADRPDRVGVPEQQHARRAAARWRTEGEPEVVASRAPADGRRESTGRADLAAERGDDVDARSTAALSSLGDSIADQRLERRQQPGAARPRTACSSESGIGHGYNRCLCVRSKPSSRSVLGAAPSSRPLTPAAAAAGRGPGARRPAPPARQPRPRGPAEAPPTEVALGVAIHPVARVPRIVQRRPGPALLPVRLDAPASPTSSPTIAAC